jgi:2-dehydro-3-deoxy-D-arabinonate dehydratase
MQINTTTALVKYHTANNPTPRWGQLQGSLETLSGTIISLGQTNLDQILTSADPAGFFAPIAAAGAETVDAKAAELLPPIDTQEVWGAGVTYFRSKIARQEESKSGGSFYDLVYSAERPDLFFKSTPHRTVGPNQPVRVRKDTNWCVPEPELALVFTANMQLIGVTVGNDMSARDIEGENPLYLPQAKLYDACCAIGPGIVPVSALPAREKTEIRVLIERNGKAVVNDTTTLDKMKRSFEELAGWLARDNSFPTGVILLTGTGIVPPDEFSLAAGDLVKISISGIGTLVSPVVKG